MLVVETGESGLMNENKGIVQRKEFSIWTLTVAFDSGIVKSEKSCRVEALSGDEAPKEVVARRRSTKGKTERMVSS